MKPLVRNLTIKVIHNGELEINPASAYIEIIKQAQLEWTVAQNLFNQVTEEDLIDYASYLILAAEKKYTYLIKKAKKQGLKNYRLEINT